MLQALPQVGSHRLQTGVVVMTGEVERHCAIWPCFQHSTDEALPLTLSTQPTQQSRRLPVQKASTHQLSGLARGHEMHPRLLLSHEQQRCPPPVQQQHGKPMVLLPGPLLDSWWASPLLV